jgi:hypothetical protein
MLTLYDAVTAANLPADAKYVCYYTDGRYANETAVKKRCPHATYLSITTRGGVADCADCETGDLTVLQAEAWVASRLAAGAHRPCVYASQSRWENEGLKTGLAKYGSKVRRWVAAFPGSGANVPAGYDAHQWSDGGGKLDTSICLSDFFDSPAPPPEPDPTVRWASAQIQMSMPAGSHGNAHFYGTFDTAAGTWVIHGGPGAVRWSGPGGGKWRVKSMPYDSPPLGK